MLERLAQEEVGFLDEAKVLDVEDLLSSVMYATSPYSARSRDVPAEVPATVDQHGTNERQVSPEDMADFKE